LDVAPLALRPNGQTPGTSFQLVFDGDHKLEACATISTLSIALAPVKCGRSTVGDLLKNRRQTLNPEH